MKFLFFDVESNGKPKAYGMSYTDVDNWPRVTQLAWILCDESAVVIDSDDRLVKPAGWEIPKEDFFINNGMSTERCEEFGVPIVEIIDRFMTAKEQADALVAHNMAFDHPVIWAEIIRAGLLPISGKIKICTILRSTRYCNLPGKRGPKWPKLEELYQVLFGKGFDGAHDAKSDIAATKDCFFELVRLGIINPTEVTNKGIHA